MDLIDRLLTQDNDKKTAMEEIIPEKPRCQGYFVHLKLGNYRIITMIRSMN